VELGLLVWVLKMMLRLELTQLLLAPSFSRDRILALVMSFEAIQRKSECKASSFFNVSVYSTVLCKRSHEYHHTLGRSKLYFFSKILPFSRKNLLPRSVGNNFISNHSLGIYPSRGIFHPK
jgi:hypothetical protein